MTVSRFLQGPAGRGVASALGRVFASAPAVLVAAGVMAAGASVEAKAASFASAVRDAVPQKPYGVPQDVNRLEIALQPLKENRELYQAFLDGYKDLVEDLKDATYGPGKITARQQIGLFKDVILEHIARERRNLREWESQEEAESATPVALKPSEAARKIEEIYQSYVEGNEYLSSVITRTTEDLATIVAAGEADEASIASAFDSFLDFQAQMEELADYEQDGIVPSFPR